MLDHSEYRHRLEKYAEIKQIEEKLLEHVVLYTTYEYTSEQASRLHELHDAIVDAISSSKYIKDVSHHLDNLKENSLETVIAGSYKFFQKMVDQTTDTIHHWETTDEAKDYPSIIKDMIHGLHSDNDTFIGSLSAILAGNQEEEFNIAEVIKSHHYILLSCEALLNSYLKLSENRK